MGIDILGIDILGIDIVALPLSTKQQIKCLAQGYNIMSLPAVRLKLATL